LWNILFYNCGEVLARQEAGETFAQGKRRAVHADAQLNSFCCYIKPCTSRLGEREFNFSGSGGVKLTEDAMRFIDWDDTHIHTHGIIFLIKQAT
jgi:hypothetical protein